MLQFFIFLSGHVKKHTLHRSVWFKNWQGTLLHTNEVRQHLNVICISTSLSWSCWSVSLARQISRWISAWLRGSSGHVIRLRGVSGHCTCFEGEGETERVARKVAKKVISSYYCTVILQFNDLARWKFPAVKFKGWYVLFFILLFEVIISLTKIYKLITFIRQSRSQQLKRFGRLYLKFIYPLSVKVLNRFIIFFTKILCF